MTSFYFMQTSDCQSESQYSTGLDMGHVASNRYTYQFSYYSW